MKSFTVIGLLAADFGRVQRALAGRAQLRLIDHQAAGKKRVCALVGGACDRLVVNTRFVAHAHTTGLNKSRCVFVNGGASAVARAIEQLL